MEGLQPTGIYRLTSIGRPVDPTHPWNRALLVVLPLLAIASSGVAIATGADPLPAALRAVLTGFAAWALTRELAPDDDAAAFIALVLAFVGHVVFAANSVLPVFLALFLIRIVNRSTGLPARAFDTIAVLGFVLWAGIARESPLVLAVASIAFLLDASLADALRRHYLASLACIAVFGWQTLYGQVVFALPSAADGVLLGGFLLATLAVVRTRPAPVSRCDVSQAPLDRHRVDAGLLLGYLVAVQTVLQQGGAAWLASPLWACIAAVAVSLLIRRLI